MVAAQEVLAEQMQHAGLNWKTRAVVLLTAGLGCLPQIAHADMDAMTRVERTPAYDVALSIGPAQAMSASMQSSDSMAMGMGHDMSMGGGGGDEMSMQPHQADQGMAVNHWLDVRVTLADSGAAVSDLTPTIRIVDKSTGEARDLPGVMGVSNGMNMGIGDFHYGQNVFLPDGTYQISVLLGPSDTAQFRDVTVATTGSMAP